MTESLITLLIQNSGSLATAVVFIYYLGKKDKDNKCTFDSFNQTIQNHLQHALKSEMQMTRALGKLTNCIDTLTLKQDNRDRTTDRRYKANKE